MRAMRKKTINIFMLQLPIYYILEQKISAGANADITNTKREKQVLFVAGRWTQCLLTRLKLWSAREGSQVTARLLFTRASFIKNQQMNFYFCCWQQSESKVLSFCFWGKSGGMRQGNKSKISFCYPWGLRASPQTYCV